MERAVRRGMQITVVLLLLMCIYRYNQTGRETGTGQEIWEAPSDMESVMEQREVSQTAAEGLETAQADAERNEEGYDPDTADQRGQFDEYGEQYSLIEMENGEYEVTLYDKGNKVVHTETFTKVPWVSEMTDNILQIGMSLGSPAPYIYYYDKERAIVSTCYPDSFYLKDNYVAYMRDVSTLVVTDIFEDNELYMEISRNFSDSRHLGGLYLAIKDITWITLKGRDVLVLEYHEGEDRELQTEVIPIEDGEKAVAYNKPDELEKEYDILEYDICSPVLYDFENVHPTIKARAEYEMQNHEEICRKYGKQLKISLDYHIFDFDNDGLDDYLLCVDRELYDGRMEHWIEIYVTRRQRGYVFATQSMEDEVVCSVLHVNLPQTSQMKDTGHKQIMVLNEKTEGYYDIVLPWSNLVLKYDGGYDQYKFCDQPCTACWLNDGEAAELLNLEGLYDKDVVSDFLSMDREAFEKRYDKNGLYESDILYCTEEAWKYHGEQLDGFSNPKEYFEVDDIWAIRFVNPGLTDQSLYVETEHLEDVRNRIMYQCFEDYAVSMYFQEKKDAQGKPELELTELSFIKVKLGEYERRKTAPKKLYEILESGYYEAQEEIEAGEWAFSPKKTKAVCISNGALPKHPSQIFVRCQEKAPDLIFRRTWECLFVGWIDEEHFLFRNDIGLYMVHIENRQIEEIVTVSTQEGDFETWGCRYEIRGDQVIATCIHDDCYYWDIVREAGEISLVWGLCQGGSDG